MTPYIIQPLAAHRDRNGNARGLWAVYSYATFDPYRVSWAGPTPGRLEAMRAFAELVGGSPQQAVSLLADCPWLAGQTFIVMPERYVTVPEFRAMWRRVRLADESRVAMNAYAAIAGGAS